jgi:hypothetical protein
MLITEKQVKSRPLLGQTGLENSQRVEEETVGFRHKLWKYCTDDWDSFVSAFKDKNHLMGKRYTVGIEGNNCIISFRKTCKPFSFANDKSLQKDSQLSNSFFS